MQEQRTAASDEMPFLDHLEELRWRIIWSLAALIISVGLAFWVLLQFDVIGVLEKPILPYLRGHKLVYTHPGDPFSIVLNASIALGATIALPVIFYQLWSFVSPALHRHEKKLVMPMFLFATFLFLSGVSLSWFVVLPLALPWLMSFGTTALEPMITASEYFGFAISMTLGLRDLLRASDRHRIHGVARHRDAKISEQVSATRNRRVRDRWSVPDTW